MGGCFNESQNRALPGDKSVRLAGLWRKPLWQLVRREVGLLGGKKEAAGTVSLGVSVFSSRLQVGLPALPCTKCMSSDKGLQALGFSFSHL